MTPTKILSQDSTHKCYHSVAYEHNNNNRDKVLRITNIFEVNVVADIKQYTIHMNQRIIHVNNILI